MCTTATRLSAACLYTHQNSNEEEGNLLVAEIREVISISGILLHARLDCVSMCSGMVSYESHASFLRTLRATARLKPPSLLPHVSQPSELRARSPCGSQKDNGGNHPTHPRSNPVVATRETSLSSSLLPSSISSLCEQPRRRCETSVIIAAVKFGHLGSGSGPPSVNTSPRALHVVALIAQR